MSQHRPLNWRYVLGIWSVLGLVFILQAYLVVVDSWLDHFRDYRIAEHIPGMASQIFRAWLWAALTPVIFWLRREVHRRHPQWYVAAGLHLLGAWSAYFLVNLVRLSAYRLLYGLNTLETLTVEVVYRGLTVYSLIDFYLYWIVLLIARMMDLDWQKKLAELREERMCTQLAQAELVALKQQVQPHFLYNALNTVSSLIREGEGTKAVEALAQLSQLFRRLMACAGCPEIELRSELDYAQAYLQVEQVRFEEKLRVHCDADERCLGAIVPTLMLQPLVENAVKHGIAQRRNPGRISVTARCDATTLILQVTNDPAEGGRRVQESDNHGIGLSATRARLERTFGDRYRLDLRLDGPGGTVVTIELPLQFTKTPPAAP